MGEILIPKFTDYAPTTREKFFEKFQKNLQYPNGWARSFKSFDDCVKAWFY